MEKMDQQNMLARRNVAENFAQFLEDVTAFTMRFSQNDISDVKGCISSITILCSQCNDIDELKVFVNKSCSTITKLYSKLSEYFHQFEADFIQEFYLHWKVILCCVNRTKRAQCCVRYISQMNISVGHLRTAAHRLEQMSILSVLCLYAEGVTPHHEVKSDNETMIEIVQLAKKSSSPNSHHTFLGYVNIDGENIFTVKPTKATPVDFAFDFPEQKQKVFLDFNLKNHSIAFVVLSSSTKEFQCLGIASRPRVQQYSLQGEYQLVFGGRWTMVGGCDNSSGNIFKIMFTCRLSDKVIVDSLIGQFNISVYRNYDREAVQDESADRESVDAKTVPTMIFQDSHSRDGDDEEDLATAVGVLPGSSSPEFSNSDDMDSCESDQAWKYILNDDHQTERLTEMFTTEIERFHEQNPSLDVNCVSDQNSIATEATPSHNNITRQRMDVDPVGESNNREKCANEFPQKTTTGQIKTTTTRRRSLAIKNSHKDKNTSRKEYRTVDRNVEVDKTDSVNEPDESARKRARFSADTFTNDELLAGSAPKEPADKRATTEQVSVVPVEKTKPAEETISSAEMAQIVESFQILIRTMNEVQVGLHNLTVYVESLYGIKLCHSEQ